jgi:hypothetical protein
MQSDGLSIVEEYDEEETVRKQQNRSGSSSSSSKEVPTAASSHNNFSKCKCTLSNTRISNLTQSSKYASFSPAGVLALGPLACPFIRISMPCPCVCSFTALPVSPSPYTKYWPPKNKSQHIWKIPHSLNAQGISLVAVKNQNIFMISPAIQLARTDTRKPLQERDL